MNLRTKTICIVIVSVFLVACSILQFRWVLINKTLLQLQKETLESTQQEVVTVKNNIDKFNAVSLSLDQDAQLKKTYFDKTITFQSQFGREGVENINEVLNTIYSGDGFFELNSLSIKHQPAKQERGPLAVTLFIEGDKRLVRE